MDSESGKSQLAEAPNRQDRWRERLMELWRNGMGSSSSHGTMRGMRGLKAGEDLRLKKI